MTSRPPAVSIIVRAHKVDGDTLKDRTVMLSADEAREIFDNDPTGSVLRDPCMYRIAKALEGALSDIHS